MRDVLRPDHPFALHQALHAAVFAGWDERVLGPAPVWVPSASDVANTNLAAFMDRFSVRRGQPLGFDKARLLIWDRSPSEISCAAAAARSSCNVNRQYRPKEALRSFETSNAWC